MLHAGIATQMPAETLDRQVPRPAPDCDLQQLAHAGPVGGRPRATSIDSITLSDGEGQGRTLAEPPLWAASVDLTASTSPNESGKSQMMPRTRNYAKLGQVTWRAQVGLDDGFEPHARTIAEREFRSARSKGLARAFVTATLRGLRNPPAV